MKSFSNLSSLKNSLIKKLHRAFSDKTGSILTLVVVIGAALFTLTLALLTTVATTSEVNKQVDNSENAYLAARSGITMLSDAGKDAAFAQKIVDSMGNTDPIRMDFGEQGKCEAKVTDMGDAADGSGIIYKTAKVECTGFYEDNKFTLTRFLKFKQSGVTKTSELKTCAYLHYGDGDMTIDGGIEGNVYIIGGGHIQNDKANFDHPMQEVVCSNELVLSNSGCVYDLIAAGKYLVLGEATVNTEVYVGSDKLDADKKFLNELNDGIYAYLHGSVLGSILRCEGVTVIGGDASINEANALFMGDVVTGVFNPNQNAIVSGGDVYLGYNVSNTETYNPGDSYKNPSSTVDTKNGLTGNDSASQRIYGGIVSGGDVNIASTAEIYGDIVAQGDVNISANCKIHGKIYAGGNVTFSAAMNTSIDGAFPEIANRVIYAGGSVVMNSPNINRTHFGIYEGVSPVPNHGMYFNGSDFVGAADYFKDQYESAPMPTTKVPERLYSLIETRQSATQMTMVTTDCYYCDQQVRNMSVQCDWCADTQEARDAGYYVQYPWGWGHVQHMGKMEHVPHKKPTTDPPTYQNITTSIEKMHITTDTKLVGDINLPDTSYKLYIDTSVNNQNIDILLDGNINVGNGGGIFINDNGGENQIRFFLTEGSSINLNSGWGADYKGIYIISDAAKNTPITSLPANANGSSIDIQKVPQLYFFGEEGKSNITFDVGTYGYIPGYVLTPYIDIQAASNAHCYVSQSVLGKNPNDPTQPNNANYPFFYGMLMCNSLEFNQGTNTFVKYDDRLDDIPDPADPSKMVKSEIRKKFDAALARDGVMTFGSGSGSTGGSTGTSTTYTWTVDSCY